MRLSNELQAGKAAEHLVCADLILQGFNAFLADQGLPYDVLVDLEGKIIRVQVKSTHCPRDFGQSKSVYRFGTRKARKGSRTTKPDEVDFFAFVGLDIRTICYIPVKEMISKSGDIKQTIEFKTRRIKYKGRKYPNGTVRETRWGRFIEDHSEFKPHRKP